MAVSPATLAPGRSAALIASMADGRWRQVVLSYDSPMVEAGMGIPSAVASRLMGSGMVDVDRQHSVSLHGTRYTYVRLNAAGIARVRASVDHENATQSHGLPIR
jgi:hypothetical protein